MEANVQEETITISVKEFKELRKGFLMLRGLFDTSIEYADRITPTDMSHQRILSNNLIQGQTKSQLYFEKAKKLESNL